MLLQSWKKLEDKTYMIGGFTQKAKPRDLIREIMKEGEVDFLRRTGIKEAVWSETFDWSGEIEKYQEMNMVYLPHYMGRIKSVMINGNWLERGESHNFTLDKQHKIPDTTPTAWNLMGHEMLWFDGKLKNGDTIQVHYEHVDPSENIYIPIYKWDGLSAGENNLYKRWVYTEAHADNEFADFWNKNPKIKLLLHKIDTIGVPTTESITRISCDANGKWFRYGRTGGTCAGYDDDGSGVDDPQPTTESFCILGDGGTGEVLGTWTDDGKILEYYTDTFEGHQGSGIEEDLTYKSGAFRGTVSSDLTGFKGIKHQRFSCDLLANDYGAGLGNGYSLQLTNYRDLYGPTIDRGFVQYLPYYALGIIMHAEDPKTAEFYMQKWINSCEERQDEFSDNDLNYSIKTQTRSNWRY